MEWTEKGKTNKQTKIQIMLTNSCKHNYSTPLTSSDITEVPISYVAKLHSRFVDTNDYSYQ